MICKQKIIELILIISILFSILILIITLNKPFQNTDYFLVSNDIIEKNNQQYTALYINLENRQDRKIQFEDELKKQDFYNFKRFNAIKDPVKGYIGCSKSHLECLKIAKQNNYPYVIIFEDDFEFLINKDEFHTLLNNLLQIEYDVFMLGYNTIEFLNITSYIPDKSISHSGDLRSIYRIKNTQTASGYIVNRRYYDRLINNFQDGLNLLQTTDVYSNYAIDQYWKRLQDKDIWLCYKKRIGKQRASYSDIEKRLVDYQV